MTDQTRFCLSLASRLMSLLGLLPGVWRRAYFQEQESIKGSCIPEKPTQRKRGRWLTKAASLEQALCTTYRQRTAQSLFSPAIVAAYITLGWGLVNPNFQELPRPSTFPWHPRLGMLLPESYEFLFSPGGNVSIQRK